MKIVYTIIYTFIVFFATAQEGFIKIKNGVQYKLITENVKGTPIQVGNTVQLSQLVKFGDSTLQNTDESGTDFVKIETEDPLFSVTSVVRNLKKGDSVHVQVSCDTVYKKQFALAAESGITREEYDKNMPDFLKKEGAFVDIWVKVLHVYANDSLAAPAVAKEDAKRQAYQEKMMRLQAAEQAKKDKPGFAKCNADFKKFLGPKLKTLLKTPSGAYLQILKPGTGALPKKGKTAEVRYRGTLLNGLEFDSNMPVKGQEPKPLLSVVVSGGTMIKAFDEAIAMLKKGAKAKLYLPCNLGYGGQAAGMIPAYANLIFEIEIVTIK
jgi:FKBP-type peptidyl-prolyl cis-trans isomerase